MQLLQLKACHRHIRSRSKCLQNYGCRCVPNGCLTLQWSSRTCCQQPQPLIQQGAAGANFWSKHWQRLRRGYFAGKKWSKSRKNATVRQLAPRYFLAGKIYSKNNLNFSFQHVEFWGPSFQVSNTPCCKIYEPRIKQKNVTNYFPKYSTLQSCM